ncbi:MAG: hypothetical protein E6H06_07965 [Bacteroidetes bacterium]|nr:MAG: hypothetical protein E6H06_07965 [Bacteroidota bacterium]
MITRIKNTVSFPLLTLAVAAILLASCKKETSQSSLTSQTSSSTIAVAASESGPTSADDSVYVIQPCPHGYSRDSISAADLPSTVITYLSTDYPGFTFSKAFAVKNSSGQTAAYVAIIYFNDKPVAILFDSNGNFVRVLEQRDKGDIDGKGWHDGGRFCDRNGLQKDTVALSALPTSILSYIAANYSTDTLVKAFQNRHDSSFVVISKNNGLFATVFDSSGNFVKRVTLPAPPGIAVGITESALPANVLSYLSTTYPDYVFEKAFAVYNNSNVLQGYAVVINANNTKYAVLFDASGNFVSVKTIW